MKISSTIAKHKPLRGAPLFDRISRRPPRWVRWGLYAAAIAGLIAARYHSHLQIFFPFAFVVPVLLASWWDGRRWGYTLAVVSMALLQGPPTPIHLATRAIGMIILVECVSRTADMTRRVRVLEGLLSMCGFCHGIRDKNGQWLRLEEFVQNHSEAAFLHTYCPSCIEELNPRQVSESIH